MTSDPQIAVSVKVSTPYEWLEINDGPYELAAESFREKAVTQRTVQATNPFLEGSHTVSALRENVQETLAVYVRGPAHFDMEVALRVLTDAFDQPYYRIVRGIKGSWEVWFAGAAGYRIETSVEMLHATMAKVTFDVPRHPVVQLTAVEPT